LVDGFSQFFSASCAQLVSVVLSIVIYSPRPDTKARPYALRIRKSRRSTKTPWRE
jgi:hypothetical protein